MKCTQKTVLDACLASLDSAGLVVVSILENFIVSVCRDVSEEEVQLFARQQVTDIVDKLHSVVQRIPDANIILLPPMYRSVPDWFGSYLPDLLSFLSAELAHVNSSHLAACSPFIVLPSMLDPDGIHLNPAAGDRFMIHLDDQLQSLLVSVPDLSVPSDDRLDQILQVVSRNSSQLESFRSLGETVSDLTRSASTFESFVHRCFKDDDLIFARMKEEADADVNRSCEDRVVITGLTGPAAAISTHAEKKVHYKELVTRLVTIACAASEVVPQVLDVYINFVIVDYLSWKHDLTLFLVPSSSAARVSLWPRQSTPIFRLSSSPIL